MTGTGADNELHAIDTVLGALNALDPEARTRVIDYVFSRLGLRQASTLTGSVHAQSAGLSAPPPPAAGAEDIRSFRETKAPRSANEMAALVAYYLAELAPEGERKSGITAADLKKYFNQARYPLPRNAQMTLINAKNGGYLDTAGGGVYRLNPVGFNLVAYGLPTSQETERPGRTRPVRSGRRGHRRLSGNDHTNRKRRHVQ